MDIITIDYETYYDQEYSLSKLTTEEYIRDPRFEVIGLAVKVNDGPTQHHTGDYQSTLTFLRQFDWANSAMLAQNTMFDGAIHNWRFGIKAKAYFDTMCMARTQLGTEVSVSLAKLSEHYGLGVKGHEVVAAKGKKRKDFSTSDLHQYIAGYCVNDVELTYKLFKRLMVGFPKIELKVIDVTLRMFIDPIVELDILALEGHLYNTKQMKEKLIVDSGYTKKELMSNPKFALALESLGVVPPMKKNAKGLDAYAFAKTDKGFQDLLEHEDTRVQALVAARLGNKGTLEETRTERFIGIAKRGSLPAPIKYFAAHTSRWGGCLVADTQVVVLNLDKCILTKKITDVLITDLVWDGLEFVSHEGVQFSGYSEVIEHDGVKGTKDHVVFTDAGEISLLEALQGEHNITTAKMPEGY